MNRRKIFLILYLLSAAFLLSGCPLFNREDNPGENRQPARTMPPEIGIMEEGLIEIMQLADSIPVTGDSGDTAGEEKQQIQTFEETILGEVLRREAGEGDQNGEDQQYTPTNVEEIWDNIKLNIEELHDRWDGLEPVLDREKISPAVITDFEDGLNRLTIAGTRQDYSGTLNYANRLTGHLSNFMIPFTENSLHLAYEFKFHVRNILLNVAAGSYEAAQMSLDYMQEQKPALVKDIEEEPPPERVQELHTSLENLQEALNSREPDLVKIKAAVVMENLVQIIGNLD